MTLAAIRDETDAGTFRDVFEYGYHRPLYEMRDPKMIVDLGSNAGYTIMDFADRYPTTHVLGAELDTDNYLTALSNTSRYGTRVEIERCAILDYDGQCSYAGAASNAYIATIGEGTPCWTLDTFLERHKVTQIDYLKIDVEGAEASILKSGGRWPSITKQVSVELHNYDEIDAKSDLVKLGFFVTKHPTHPSAMTGLMIVPNCVPS
jgi:FkbM family methyltransferase